MEKAYYTISEVSKMLGIQPHNIRYWETEFKRLKTKTKRGYFRKYTPKDIQFLKIIKELIIDRKFTLEGAKAEYKRLTTNFPSKVEGVGGGSTPLSKRGRGEFKKIIKDKLMVENILTESQALLKGHFLLTSGRHSEYYVEKIKIINNPQNVDYLCELLTKKLSNFDCDVVVGPAYGGIVLAYEVAKKIGKKFVFTQRKEEKMTIRSGFEIKSGDRAIIIEDIVTTGGSVNEVIETLADHEVEIVAIGCIVDRSNGTYCPTDQACQAEGAGKGKKIPFVPLLTMQIESWLPSVCPLCKNDVPLMIPGASDKKKLASGFIVS
jgi:orotate phosphoribosyltransferase